MKYLLMTVYDDNSEVVDVIPLSADASREVAFNITKNRTDKDFRKITCCEVENNGNITLKETREYS